MMSSSQEKQTEPPRARAEAGAEADDLSFGSEPEFLEKNNEFEHLENRNNQFEHHTVLARPPNNPSTDFIFDTTTNDEMNARHVMDVFMEVQREEREREERSRERNQEHVQRNQEHVQRIFLLFISLLFFVIFLHLLILWRWGNARYYY
ncbi:uncharacterized protein LY89DRAFT_726723 [Mollisia scopiformis]|uniref:Uncharacterized protein n=1 Tax=Mollisia scopiformis TaxID=149040 RepID=A0A132B1B5_MOLSC|nr:uncharacterized protein LY89DRAFT_726723 [Mollisia scopiformis]KUJ06166.1 hypothetical protein LY89DRAFT_726723 [Mollisia scopiformis]